jgi:NAD(P)-dependent dehydrogenase (short-subunit alcohol dehydrogenase family)
MTDIAGKTIYITGGASGMGLMSGKMLAAPGAHIVIFRSQSDRRRVVRRHNGSCRSRRTGHCDHHGRYRGAEEFVNMKFETFDRATQKRRNHERRNERI